MSTKDAIGLIIMAVAAGTIVLFIAKSIIGWLFGTNEINSKLDEIIELLKKKDGDPHV